MNSVSVMNQMYSGKVDFAWNVGKKKANSSEAELSVTNRCVSPSWKETEYSS